MAGSSAASKTMFQRFSDVVIALVDLLEAEGRNAKRHAWKFAVAVGIYAVGIVVLMGAVGFLVAGLYLGLTTVLHPAWVATICGGALLLVGVIAVWLANDRVD